MAIPSTILYILEMVTIIRHKQFAKLSFYKLFCVRAIADILWMLSSSYGNRIPALFGQQLLPIYRMMPGWAIVLCFYFASTVAFQASNIATFLILMNRFTAIAFPLKQKRIWEKQSFLIILALIVLVVPLLCCLPIMKMNVTPMAYERESDGFFIREIEMDYSFIGYLNGMKSLTSVIFLLLSLLVNVSTLIAYRRSKKVHQQNSQNGNDVIEKKLLIYALLTFAGHAFVSVFLIIMGAGFLYGYASITFTQYPWINDLCTSVLSSWMLLFTSSIFRHQFIKDFCPKCIWPMPNNFQTPVTDLKQNQNDRRLFEKPSAPLQPSIKDLLFGYINKGALEREKAVHFLQKKLDLTVPIHEELKKFKKGRETSSKEPNSCQLELQLCQLYQRWFLIAITLLTDMPSTIASFPLKRPASSNG
ncbi:hypothetical protein niasHS_010455 [Heterodera schachtii]|uniref:Serpentine receptor class gamma n=1 Tax=Heterodera schachtii TaxID=97005 RepID=A0ABD2J1D3_HETSC